MSEKTSEVTPALSRFGWFKSKSFWFLVLWLTGGIVLFAKYRNIIYGFPTIIFVWLFLCIAWFGIPRWKWWGIPITLLLTILACMPLSIVYLRYESQETDRALKEFVLSTIAGKSSSKFSIDGDDLSTMSADFTADFTIVSRDNFWMEYEQVIRFTNGSEYHVVIVQDSPGHWEVRAQRVKPPSQTVEVITASPSSTNTVPPSPTPTVVPSSTPSPTLAPSRMPTRTPKPTRTPYPTSTPSPTPYPTVNPNERAALIETLLKASAQCEFPCWGEMIPGKTSWEDVVTRVRGFGLRKGGTDFLQYALLDMSWCPTCGEGKLVFVGREGYLVTIHIAATVPGDVDPEGMLSTYLAQFRLSDVLTRYGIPSHIYVESEWGFYDKMWVEYAPLGLLINYSVDTISDAVGPLVCPVMKGTQDIALNLQPPGSTFQTYRDNIRIVSELTLDGIELKEVKEVSPEEFYAAFQQMDSANCLRMVDAASEHFTPVLPANFSWILRPEEDTPLLELLATNGGCELPCWWGITPGVTPMQDVQALFAGYGKAMGVWNVDGVPVYEMGFWGRHDPPPLDYVIRHKFSVQDGVVSTIYVRGTAPLYFYGWGDGPAPRIRMEGELPALMHSHYLTQDWQRYSLPPMLARFGVPSQVILHYNHQMCGNEYLLGIAYDDLGVFIQYNGEARHENNAVVICPSLEKTANFHLVLTTPDSGIKFADYMTCGYWCAPVSLETVGNMSSATFYHAYVDPATTACFTVPERAEYTCP